MFSLSSEQPLASPGSLQTIWRRLSPHWHKGHWELSCLFASDYNFSRTNWCVVYTSAEIGRALTCRTSWGHLIISADIYVPVIQHQSVRKDSQPITSPQQGSLWLDSRRVSLCCPPLAPLPSLLLLLQVCVTSDKRNTEWDWEKRRKERHNLLCCLDSSGTVMELMADHLKL